MQINIGWTEVLIGALTVVLSIGGSWVVLKEQMATMSEKLNQIEGHVEENSTIIKEQSEDTSRMIKELGDKLSKNWVEVSILGEKNRQLSESTKEYKETLEKLGVVLTGLHNTLVRLDERMKSVEEGVRALE